MSDEKQKGNIMLPTDIPQSSQPLAEAFLELVQVIAKLRDPKTGCPWDLEQTPKTLCPYIIEEAFELVEALESKGSEAQADELGDYLFQFLLQTQIATESQQFSLQSVLVHAKNKLVERHPHVFGQDKLGSAEEVWRSWHQRKNQQSGRRHFMSFPRDLPALTVAHKIGVKSAGIRFDWQNPTEVLAKVLEEQQELQAAMKGSLGQAELAHEVGDLLFSVAQLARHLGLDAEQCLRQANRRFVARIDFALNASASTPEEFSRLPDHKKEELWRLAKTAERANSNQPSE